MQTLVESLRLVAANFRVLFVMGLLFSLPLVVVGEVLGLILFPDNKFHLQGLIVLQIIGVLFNPFLQAAVVHALDKVHRNKSAKLFDAFSLGILFWPRLVFANILRLAVVLLLVVLLMSTVKEKSGVAANFYLMFNMIMLFATMRIPFFDFKIVLENKSTKQSLHESFVESKVVMLAMFVTLIPLSFVAVILVWLSIVMFPHYVLLLIFQTALMVILYIVYQAIFYLLYHQLRTIRENMEEKLDPDKNVKQ